MEIPPDSNLGGVHPTSSPLTGVRTTGGGQYLLQRLQPSCSEQWEALTCCSKALPPVESVGRKWYRQIKAAEVLQEKKMAPCMWNKGVKESKQIWKIIRSSRRQHLTTDWMWNKGGKSGEEDALFLASKWEAHGWCFHFLWSFWKIRWGQLWLQWIEVYIQ